MRRLLTQGQSRRSAVIRGEQAPALTSDRPQIAGRRGPASGPWAIPGSAGRAHRPGSAEARDGEIDVFVLGQRSCPRAGLVLTGSIPTVSRSRMGSARAIEAVVAKHSQLESRPAHECERRRVEASWVGLDETDNAMSATGSAGDR